MIPSLKATTIEVSAAVRSQNVWFGSSFSAGAASANNTNNEVAAISSAGFGC
ncbi:hypothetical protein [Coxiella-like endosymbiont]|uniref:hypothetical protein n=1 Tax=Coxiella-like endosymbiont TaxID=1592897 RepID=UPI00272B535B|nr:hypothetical protein [Coxiella-like endosymbiont]